MSAQGYALHSVCLQLFFSFLPSCNLRQTLISLPRPAQCDLAISNDPLLDYTHILLEKEIKILFIITCHLKIHSRVLDFLLRKRKESWGHTL